ncbi:hypothetical protein D3C78_1198270 [compost metagenome]
MALTYGNLQGFATPVMAGEARRDFFKAPQHQVELAAVQRIDRQAGGQRGDVQAQVGGTVLQVPQQFGHAQLLDEVGHGDAKSLSAQARVEAFADIQGLFDLLQRRANRALKGQGFRGGLHAPANTHQQRVFEQLTQACQGVTDGWLAEGQAFGGARDILLAQQDVEDAQQVEIEVGYIHFANITHMKMKFLK